MSGYTVYTKFGKAPIALDIFRMNLNASPT